MRARMRQTYLLAMVGVAVMVVHAGTALAQPGSPTNIGTWKLNPREVHIHGKTITISTTVTNALEMGYNSAALSRPSASVGHGPVSVAVYDRR